MVGIGPGGREDRTHRAERAIADAEVILGYRPYLELISDLTTGKDVRPSGMRQEVSRVDEALDEAVAGRRVVLVSSGDAGIYGMAGVALERAEERDLAVPIETVAGVTASSAAAALLGAPLMLDFVTLSLSDLLVPWQTIARRLALAAEADFVIALYNPRSRTRTAQFSEARAILLRHRGPSTPVGLARGMGHADQSHRLTTLGDLNEAEVDMRTIVVVGNSTTRASAQWMFTPRGYFQRDP